jgi:hypothetical protein
MCLIALLGIMAALLSPLTYHNQVGLVQVKTWLDNSQLAFLCWRLGMLVIIFISWSWFVRYKAKQRQWPEKNISKAMHLRYYLIVFLLLLDVIFQWGQL